MANGNVMLKNEELGTYYITLDEWSGANMRLGAHMIRTGVLSAKEAIYYMAYTAMISDLAAKYEWQSVLEFDSRYRMLQAEHGFLWGTDNPHSERHILIPKIQQVLGKGKTGSRWTGRKGGEDGEKPYCRNFLSGHDCDFGEKCKYRHEYPPKKAGKVLPKNDQ